MEPLGRKSDSSFRSALSCRHSYRSRSHRKRPQPELTTVTKQQVRKTLCVCVCGEVFGFCVYTLSCLCLQINFPPSDLNSPAPVHHERITGRLWAWTGFHLSHRGHFSPVSSYPGAKPESDQRDFAGAVGQRQAGQPQEWLLWLPSFWEAFLSESQDALRCPTHYCHQSHVRKQSDQAWQCLLGGEHGGAGRQCLRQLELFLRGLPGGGASFLTNFFRWPFHQRIISQDNAEHPCNSHSCRDNWRVEQLFAQQQQTWPSFGMQRAKLRQGHGRPEGQHGLKHYFS